MGRIRTIKPEFPQSETVGKLSRDARLLFIQLWTIADDAGRARAASRMLASLLYPYDDDAPALIEFWLGELEQNGMIRRYVVDGNAYLEIVKWLDHQKIDRPSASKLPAFVDGSQILASPREPSTTDLGPRTRTKDHSSAVDDRPAREPSRFDEFWQAYPRRDGDNPRKPAETKFNALVKSGLDPAMLIDAIRKYAGANVSKIGTPYIPQASTWLNQQRWSDHAAVAPSIGAGPAMTLEQAVAQYAKLGTWSRHAPCTEPGTLGCNAPAELLARYGLDPDGRKLPREAA